jgi:hypothetical protein
MLALLSLAWFRRRSEQTTPVPHPLHEYQISFQCLDMRWKSPGLVHPELEVFAVILASERAVVLAIVDGRPSKDNNEPIALEACDAACLTC